MYKQWNRLLAFLMTVAVVMTSLTYPVKADTTDPWDSVASTDWMAKIDGDLKITQINIPGTHDSGTKYVEASNYSQCQDKTIAEQLAAGIRFLDIRVEMDSDGNLRLVHGSTACKDSAGNKLYLDTVLSDCYAFLDAHPTEAIIMSIKKDNGDATDAKVQAAVHKYIDANAQYWSTQNGKSPLKDVRGKIVLARRYKNDNNYSDSKGGMHFVWGDQGGSDVVDTPYVRWAVTGLTGLWVQDRYEYSASNKWTAVQTGLDNPPGADNRANEYFLNFLSSAGNKILGIPASTPKKIAESVNAEFTNYEMTQGKSYGYIIMDFVTEELARKVIKTNICTSAANLELLDGTLTEVKQTCEDAKAKKCYTEDSLKLLTDAVASADTLRTQLVADPTITAARVQEEVAKLKAAAESTLELKTAAQLEKYLSGWYPLSENANDRSANGNDGTAQGVTFSRDNGVTITGSGKLQSYISLPTTMFDGQDNLTISFWAKDTGTDASRNQAVFSFGSGTSADPNTSNVYKYLLINTSNKTSLKTVMTKNSWKGESGFTTECNYPKNTWAQITCVLNGTNLTLYKDGELIGTKNTGVKVSDFGTNRIAYIGNSIWGGSDNDYIGNVKDLRIYQASLEAEQVEEIYQYMDNTLPAEYTKEDIVSALESTLATKLTANADGSYSLGITKDKMTLPATGYGNSGITWASSDKTVIDPATGNITLPEAGAKDETVDLTATITTATGKTSTILFVCTVYAKEPEKQKYTVSFDAADGTMVSAVEVEEGSTVEKPADPVREGYTFEGWYINGATEAFDFTIAVTQNMTLTAKWTKKAGSDTDSGSTDNGTGGGSGSTDNGTGGGSGSTDNGTGGGSGSTDNGTGGGSGSTDNVTDGGSGSADNGTGGGSGSTDNGTSGGTTGASNGQTAGSADASTADDSQTEIPKTQVKLGKASISKVTAKSGKKLQIKIRKASGAKGYEISYSLNKKFKSAKKVTVKKTTYTIRKLKKGKIYYIRIRPYTKSDGKMVYGTYSKTVKKKVTK